MPANFSKIHFTVLPPTHKRKKKKRHFLLRFSAPKCLCNWFHHTSCRWNPFPYSAREHRLYFAISM